MPPSLAGAQQVLGNERIDARDTCTTRQRSSSRSSGECVLSVTSKLLLELVVVVVVDVVVFSPFFCFHGETWVDSHFDLKKKGTLSISVLAFCAS